MLSRWEDNRTAGVTLATHYLPPDSVAYDRDAVYIEYDGGMVQR